ncbi:TIGR03663 family protein [Verrucomicrobiaceae bacterium N1E253]|uniref:TIGR03663 family protein n=1 Tax=Oceaniferula marina TaxID=2748318 RepID=A0A851GK68_9BACT|nr:flippase activity-associated protein Agl23 [Oceaniferula marina]NWK56251.1 TIGR03663 family protein [Oceaniferula marina]
MKIPTPIQTALPILCWIGVLALAVGMRFEHLSKRPFHFDEATGARITAQRMDPASGYEFNPVHNHGPLLSAVASPICHLNGESTWPSMTKLSLRLVPAIAGSLLVLVPLIWRKRFGHVPMLAAAAFLASSPLLVYYSRMFIHEMILALCGLLCLTLIGRYSTSTSNTSRNVSAALAGITLGLMFATKESFAISVIAWSGSATLVFLSQWPNKRTCSPRLYWKRHQTPILIGLGSAGLSSAWFYTNGFTNPGGAWDAVRTFFIYQTGAGHDKAFSYYFEMLAIPKKAAIWWFETPVLILAAISMIRAHLPGSTIPHVQLIRFLSYASIGHLLIYSLIAYKTPWLMCLPWAHFCLLAGLSFSGIHKWRLPLQGAALLVLIAVTAQQSKLSRFATGRFASDARNPYAYSPTNRDIESVRDWLAELSKGTSPGSMEPIAVVGREYWPLPWYLRDFQQIGYWPQPEPVINQCAVVFAMPEAADAVSEQLEHSHMILPRTLRSQVPVMMYLRKDHWQRWMEPETP